LGLLKVGFLDRPVAPYPVGDRGNLDGERLVAGLKLVDQFADHRLLVGEPLIVEVVGKTARHLLAAAAIVKQTAAIKKKPVAQFRRSLGLRQVVLEYRVTLVRTPAQG